MANHLGRLQLPAPPSPPVSQSPFSEFIDAVAIVAVSEHKWEVHRLTFAHGKIASAKLLSRTAFRDIAEDDARRAVRGIGRKP